MKRKTPKKSLVKQKPKKSIVKQKSSKKPIVIKKQRNNSINKNRKKIQTIRPDEIQPDQMDNINFTQVLGEEDKQKCIEAFQAFDYKGKKKLGVSEVRSLLEDIGQQPTEEQIYQMINCNVQQGRSEINQEQFLQLMAIYKIEKDRRDWEDAVNAFVAMGGNQDGTGGIQKDRLLEICKEFQLSINIHKLLEVIDQDGSGLIEFDEFRRLIQQ